MYRVFFYKGWDFKYDLKLINCDDMNALNIPFLWYTKQFGKEVARDKIVSVQSSLMSYPLLVTTEFLGLEFVCLHNSLLVWFPASSLGTGGS